VLHRVAQATQPDGSPRKTAFWGNSGYQMTAKCICYGSGPHSQTALEKEAHAKGFGVVGHDATSLHLGGVRKSIARRAIASAKDGFYSRQIISSALICFSHFVDIRKQHNRGERTRETAKYL
jgi:hypothetical protein